MADYIRSLYRPLSSNEFRLLSIAPGTRWTPINATITTTSFADAPLYNALSYAWGSESYNSEFSLNSRQMLIRHNLWMFLQRIRAAESETKTLWVDALCISQSDPEEKRKQVSMLGTIFSQAHTVFAWLGEHDAYSRYIYDNPIQLLRLAMDNDWAIDTVSNHPLRPIAWKHFLLRPYWWRTWIVPELALSRNVMVYCGNDTIRWEDLIELARSSGYASADWICQDSSAPLSVSTQPHRSMWYLDGKIVLNKLEQLNQIRERYRVQKSQTPTSYEMATKCCHENWRIDELPHLMRICSQNQCLDPRDRVYALLSIEFSKTAFSIPITPDYKITPWELFIRVYLARACATATENELFAAELMDALEVMPTLSLEFINSQSIDLQFLKQLKTGLNQQGRNCRWLLPVLKAMQLHLPSVQIPVHTRTYLPGERGTDLKKTELEAVKAGVARAKRRATAWPAVFVCQHWRLREGQYGVNYETQTLDVSETWFCSPDIECDWWLKQ